MKSRDEQALVQKMRHDARERFWRERFEKTARECEEDHSIALWSEHSFHLRIEKFLEVFTRENPGKKGLILDLGCGPGTYSCILHDMGHELVGVDYSSSMIARARDKSGGRQISFLAADLYSLPFQTGSFDTVVCMGVFQYVTREEDALREIRRVMKEGSTLFLNAPNALSFRVFSRRAIQSLKSLFSGGKSGGVTGTDARSYDPYHLRNVLDRLGIGNARIHGVYVLPEVLLPVESVLRKLLIFRLMDMVPYLPLLIAHDFLLKASPVE